MQRKSRERERPRSLTPLALQHVPGSFACVMTACCALQPSLRLDTTKACACPWELSCFCAPSLTARQGWSAASRQWQILKHVLLCTPGRLVFSAPSGAAPTWPRPAEGHQAPRLPSRANGAAKLRIASMPTPQVSRQLVAQVALPPLLAGQSAWRPFQAPVCLMYALPTSERFAGHDFGMGHAMKPHRVRLADTLIRAYGVNRSMLTWVSGALSR